VGPNIEKNSAGSPCGLVVYEGKLLPERFRGMPLHAEAGKRVVRGFLLSNDGAGYSTKIEDMAYGEDSWYRPSDVAVARGPEPVSRWRLLGLIPATSCASVYFGWQDRRTMLPSPDKLSDNRSPSASRASWTIARGIRTAKLFPHFSICVSFGIWIH